MVLVVGAGVLAQMQAMRDAPLLDSHFSANSDGSQWERGVGSKGVYIASNASGQWQSAGPLTGGASVAPPPAAGPSLWVDASNWTQAITDQGCAELKAAGVVGVIVQAVVGIDNVTYTAQQLQACVRNGLRIQGYVWCTPGASKSVVAARLALFEGYDLEALWLDVEQSGLKVADVDRDLPMCDAYMAGKLTGVYSGRWFFAQQGWLNWTTWSNRPLWDSNYDHVPVVATDFRPYGGWTVPVVKQYAGTSAIGSVHQIDLDVAA